MAWEQVRLARGGPPADGEQAQEQREPGPAPVRGGAAALVAPNPCAVGGGAGEWDGFAGEPGVGWFERLSVLRV